MMNINCNSIFLKEHKKLLAPRIFTTTNVILFILTVISAFKREILGVKYLADFLKQKRETFNIQSAIIISLLAFVLFLILIIAWEFFSQEAKEYNTLLSNPSPVTFVRQNRKISLNEFMTEILFFNDEFTKNMQTVYNHILINRRVYKTNTSMLFSGLPGIGKTRCARKLLELLGGGYIVSISRLIKLGKVGIEVLENIVQKAYEKKLNLLFDDGELGLIGRKLILDHKQYEKDKDLVYNIELFIYKLMDIIVSKKTNIIFTSNLLSMFDRAFSRRFDEYIEFPMPDLDQLKGIWNIKLKGVKDNNLRKHLISQYAAYSSGLSGRDLNHIFSIIRRNPRDTQEVTKVINKFQNRL